MNELATVRSWLGRPLRNGSQGCDSG